MQAARKVLNSRFSRSLSCWILPFSWDALQYVETAFHGIATINSSALQESFKNELTESQKAFKELLQRKRYSDATVTNYLFQFILFSNYFLVETCDIK